MNLKKAIDAGKRKNTGEEERTNYMKYGLPPNDHEKKYMEGSTVAQKFEASLF